MEEEEHSRVVMQNPMARVLQLVFVALVALVLVGLALPGGDYQPPRVVTVILLAPVAALVVLGVRIWRTAIEMPAGPEPAPVVVRNPRSTHHVARGDVAEIQAPDDGSFPAVPRLLLADGRSIALWALVGTSSRAWGPDHELDWCLADLAEALDAPVTEARTWDLDATVRSALATARERVENLPLPRIGRG